MAWIGPAIGAVVGAGISAYGVHQQNKQNKAQAQKQMDFQQYNSDSAIQRAAKDYKAAGLNPILALGSPASTPSGASASIESPLAKGVSSAIDAARSVKEIENIDYQTKNIDANTKFTNANKLKSEAETARILQQIAMDKLSMKGASAATLAYFTKHFNEMTKHGIPGMYRAVNSSTPDPYNALTEYKSYIGSPKHKQDILKKHKR